MPANVGSEKFFKQYVHEKHVIGAQILSTAAILIQPWNMLSEQYFYDNYIPGVQAQYVKQRKCYPPCTALQYR